MCVWGDFELKELLEREVLKAPPVMRSLKELVGLYHYLSQTVSGFQGSAGRLLKAFPAAVFGCPSQRRENVYYARSEGVSSINLKKARGRFRFGAHSQKRRSEVLFGSSWRSFGARGGAWARKGSGCLVPARARTLRRRVPSPGGFGRAREATSRADSRFRPPRAAWW